MSNVFHIYLQIVHHIFCLTLLALISVRFGVIFCDKRWMDFNRNRDSMESKPDKKEFMLHLLNNFAKHVKLQQESVNPEKYSLIRYVLTDTLKSLLRSDLHNREDQGRDNAGNLKIKNYVKIDSNNQNETVWKRFSKNLRRAESMFAIEEDVHNMNQNGVIEQLSNLYAKMVEIPRMRRKFAANPQLAPDNYQQPRPPPPLQALPPIESNIDNDVSSKVDKKSSKTNLLDYYFDPNDRNDFEDEPMQQQQQKQRSDHIFSMIVDKLRRSPISILFVVLLFESTISIFAISIWLRRRRRKLGAPQRGQRWTIFSTSYRRSASSSSPIIIKSIKNLKTKKQLKPR